MGYDMDWVSDKGDERSYYRLNMSGMSSMRQLLSGADCINYEATAPDFPEFDVGRRG